MNDQRHGYASWFSVCYRRCKVSEGTGLQIAIRVCLAMPLRHKGIPSHAIDDTGV